MSDMFTELVNINQLDLSNFDTSGVENMSDMFSRMENVTRIDLKNFDTHNVTSMFRMFWETPKLKILDVSHFDTHNVRRADGMFYNCGVEELDLSHFDLKAHERTIIGLVGGEGLRALNLSGFDLTRFREKEGLKPLDVPNLRLINLTNVRYDRDDSDFIQDFKNSLNKRTGPVAIVADPELFALLKSDDSGTTIGYHWNTGEGTFIDGSKTFDLIKKQNIDPNNLYAVLPTPEELAQLPVPVKPGWTFKGWKALGPESSDIAWLKVIGYTGNFMTGNYVAEYYQTDAQKFAATLQADEVVTGFDKIPDANQGMTSVYKQDNHVRNIIWQDVTAINTSFALVGRDPIAYRAIVTFWDGTTAEIMIPVRVIDDRIEDQLTIQSPKVKVKVEEPVAKATPVTKTETLPQTGEVTETMLTTLGFSLLGMIGIGGRLTKRRKNNS